MMLGFSSYCSFGGSEHFCDGGRMRFTFRFGLSNLRLAQSPMHRATISSSVHDTPSCFHGAVLRMQWVEIGVGLGLEWFAGCLDPAARRVASPAGLVPLQALAVRERLPTMLA
jgi:hypothetical protein